MGFEAAVPEGDAQYRRDTFEHCTNRFMDEAAPGIVLIIGT